MRARSKIKDGIILRYTLLCEIDKQWSRELGK
jgi:hypothetical protein